MKISIIKLLVRTRKMNLKLSFVIHILLVLMVFTACDTNQSNKLIQALKLSGENRVELEKVIQHYSRDKADSLKLKAAYFLIENMPGHYTLRGEKIDKCRKRIENDTLNSYFQKKLINIVLSHFVLDKTSYKVEDVQSIKADYLIHHIDASFKILEEYSWLDIIPFEIFLDYMLPYRFNDEPIDYWRDSLTITTHQDMKSKKLRHYFTNSFSSLNKYLGIKEELKYHHELAMEILNTNIFTDCYCNAYQKLLESRVLGIPCTINLIPFYSNRNGYHYWAAEPPIIHKEADVMGALDRRTAKFYRQTFSNNNIMSVTKNEYIPDLFMNPFMMDVTEEYLYTNDIMITINEQVKPRSEYGYLCVFNDLRWKPIAISRIKNNTMLFNKMGTNIVYLPVRYKEKDNMESLNYPFIMQSNNKIHHLVPDTCTRQSLHLSRKNPEIYDLSYYYDTMIGIVIEASNDYKFKKADTLFVCTDMEVLEKYSFQFRNNPSNQAYRWYRVSTDNLYDDCDLAEMYFYGDNGNILCGKIDSTYKAIFDRDPLTYTRVKRGHPFVIDFEKSVHVSRLNCLPRNDGNGIYPNNLYELFYWHGEGWKSLGMKTTKELFIEYKDVPTNALFWLHNVTAGVEERIFTCENDIVHFW